MTIEFDDLIPNQKRGVEFDDLIPPKGNWTDTVRQGVTAAITEAVKYTPFGLTRAPEAPAPYRSVLQDFAPAAPFNFKQASMARRAIDDMPAFRPQAEVRETPLSASIGMDINKAIQNPAGKGVIAGLIGLGQVIPGVIEAGADLVGADKVADFAAGAANQGRMMSAPLAPSGGNDKLVFDVFNSITQSSPTLMVGMAGGPAMKALFAQSAVQEYSQGKAAGLDGGSAAARAGVMAGAEVLGERFGFSEQIKILKGLSKAIPADELAPLFARQMLKEIPGEQLTTLVQFLGDKYGPGALNPEAALTDYLKQAEETFKVTLGQTAIMGGGPALIQAAQDPFGNRRPARSNAPVDVISRVMGQPNAPTAPAAPAPAPAPTTPAIDQNALADRIIAAINSQEQQTARGEPPAIQTQAVSDVAAPNMEAADLTFDDLVPSAEATGAPAEQLQYETKSTEIPNEPQATQAQQAAQEGPAQPATATEVADEPAHVGRNNIPLSEGGKAFKTRKGADDLRKMNPVMRVVRVEGGYALAPKTDAQIAAQEKASKRLRNPQTSARGEPIPAHAFIAAEGGMHPDTRADMGMQGNVQIGNRKLFAGVGRGLTIERATERLKEEGYLPPDAGHDQARDLIKRSLTSPQYTPEGFERMAEAHAAQTFEDHMAAQEEIPAEDDPFGPLGIEPDADEQSGYHAADEQTQREVKALLAMHKDNPDVDLDSLTEESYYATQGQSQDAYNAHLKAAIETAIQKGSRDSSADPTEPAQARPGETQAGRQEALKDIPAASMQPMLNAAKTPANHRQETGELTAPTRQDVLDQQAAAEQEAADKEKANRAADKQAREDEDRKRISKASQAAADTFELGGDAMANLTGQQDIFSSGNLLDIARPKDQTQTPEFKRWSNDAPLVTSAEAETYQFKTGEKVAVEAFHGTKRPDRVGTKFLKKRATSGPMAYHTSAPELASSYATGKADTSLSEEDQNYANWFKVSVPGQRNPVDIVRAWHSLPEAVKATVESRMPDIRTDDDGNVIYEEGGGGIGNYEWELKQTQRGYDRRGNPLKAAVENWLTSGSLFNEEEQFMDVLRLAGMPMQDVTYDSPTAEYPFVYKNYIAFNKPLVTSDIPQDVVDALNAAAKTDRSRAKSAGADMWDKNTRTLKSWVEAFNEPDNKYVWTSIPDKVTEVFKSLGYDGIIDWSGKGGGTSYPVYIPFEETQVKSALGNKGKFDGSKNDILKDFARRQQGNPLDRLPETAKANVIKRLDALATRLGDGAITDEQFAQGAQAVIEQVAQRKVNRGPDWVQERLIRAKRKGELEADTVDLALWALSKNPAMATDLAIMVSDTKEPAAGDYNPVTETMRLFRSTASETTAVHEILHHTERMMPPEVQAGILAEYNRAWGIAYAKGNAKVKGLMRDMLMAAAGDKKAMDLVVEGFANNTLDYDAHYSLFNPSEFWAVKASDILSNRYKAKGSWVAQAKQWLRELIQLMKGKLGLSSDAPIIKALEAVLKGDGTKFSKDVLANTELMNDVVKGGRGTNGVMPENTAPGQQGDAQQGANQGNAVTTPETIDVDGVIFSIGSVITDKWGDKFEVVGLDEKDNKRIKAAYFGTKNIVSILPSNIGAAPKAKKMWRFIKDRNSEFYWPESGSEPWIEIHNSNSSTGFTVKADNPDGNGGPEFFGIFSGDGMDSELRTPHLVIIDPEFHANHSDISYGRDVNGNKLPWSKIDKILKKIAPKLNKSEREDLFDYLDESKNVYGISKEEGKLELYFGHDDHGNASWESQRMRGKLAFAMGYKTVSMNDETGTSTLVAPGHKTYAIPEGEGKKAAQQRAYDAWSDWRASNDQSAPVSGGAKTLRDIPRTPKQSPNRDELGRVKFKLGEVALGKLDAATRPLQERFGMRMASPELRRQLRKMKATIDQANRSAANVAQQMQDMPEADRAMVSDIVEKMIAPGVVPPEHAVRVADAITKTMDRQTDELVALGMLSQDSADRWRGRYLPRIYNRKTELGEDTTMDMVKNMFKTGRPTMQGIGGGSLKGRGLFQDVSVDAVDQWTAMGYEVRDPHWKPNQGKLELVDKNAPQAAKDQVTVWRDWTPQERAEMGENRDALFRYVQGYTSMQRDIALGRLFNQIANNSDWVRRSASEGWVKVPDTEIPDTGGVKRYGNLAGLYVKPDVMSHLSQFEESANETLQLWRDALGLWKEGKTALNPVAHFNNIASNISMAHFAGVSYWDGHKYVGAARDLANDAPMVEEARNAGLFTGSFTKEELMQNMPPELQKMMQMDDSKLQKAGRQVMNALTFWLRKPLQNAYEFEDTYFKYLIYRDARQQGMSPEAATDYALKYIFTYDDLPSGARKVRDFAIPFFSWTYKAMPALLHTAMVYPWRFLAPAAMLNGINLVAYALAAGDDDDDWLEKMAKGRELEKEEREALPDRMKGTGMLLNPKSIRLGTDSLTGNPIYLDVSRVVPGGDMFDMENQAGGLPIPAPIMPNHPVLSAFSAMIANKELFMGREVTDKNDTGLEAAEKRAKWMAGFMLPAVAPGGYHSQRILDATANAMDTTIKTPLGEFTGVDRSGLPVQPKYAAMQTLGIKAKPMDLELEASRRKAQESALVNSIAAEVRSMSKLYQKGAVSDDMMERTRETAREKIERIRDKE